MVTGVLTIQMHLHGISSLKQKRSIVKSVMGRLKSRFNVSVAEVEAQDSKILAVVAIAVVATDTKFANQQLETAISFMENDPTWHHRVPNDEQYERAQRELDALLAEVTS